MKKLLSLLLILLLLCSCFTLAASAEDDEEEEPVAVEDMPDAPKTGVTINVYNWGEYIANGTEDSMDVLEEFTRVTGIDVNYTTFDTNEALYAKLAGGGANYDVIIPSDYMIARMIREDMLQEINLENIPNFKYVDDSCKNTVFDPENRYAVAYTTGVVGIFYNKNYVPEPEGWEILWDEQYKDKILMFDNPRDAFAIAMSILGYSFNTTSEDEWYEAAALLKQQKPLLQMYVMDQIFNKMESGEAWIAPYYSGDGAILVDNNDDIGFVIPKNQSTNFFIDAMCIPKGAKHKAEAEAFINFMCLPEVSGENCGYIGYSTPISAAKEYLDEETVNNPNYYPDEETLARCEVFNALPDNINTLLDSLWAEVKMGGPGDTITLVLILAVFVLAYFAVLIYKQRKKKKEL